MNLLVCLLVYLFFLLRLSFLICVLFQIWSGFFYNLIYEFIRFHMVSVYLLRNLKAKENQKFQQVASVRPNLSGQFYAFKKLLNGLDSL